MVGFCKEQKNVLYKAVIARNVRNKPVSRIQLKKHRSLQIFSEKGK